MWVCCAVERDVSSTRDAPPTPRRSAKGKLALAGAKVPSAAGGNGRNIGIGLFGSDCPLSEQPQPPGDSEGDTLLTTPPWPDAAGKLHSDTSTSASSTSPASGVSGAKTRASGLNSSQGLLRARSSRILLEAEPDDDEESEIEDVKKDRRSPLQRRNSMTVLAKHNSKSKTPEAPKKPPKKSLMKRAHDTVVMSFKGGKKTESSTSLASTESPATRAVDTEDSDEIDEVIGCDQNQGLMRRNSQFAYAESAQTAIIFDWDDTLFPTSYLMDDLRLHHKKPLREQKLRRELLEEVTQGLKELEASVLNLLKLAHRRGKIILVTLARAPWVEDSCRSFYPHVGELIKNLGIKVVYAQEGVQVDYNKRKMMNDNEVEKFYAEMKGKAISREVDRFYSQYEGQSWKNVISIGDSDFERLGTIMMSLEYMRSRGLLDANSVSNSLNIATNQAYSRNALSVEVNGHVYRLRTKTFKMLDCPTIGELREECELLIRWLPNMVTLDDGFDADLSALNDPRLLEQIEEVLAGRSPQAADPKDVKLLTK